MSDQNNFRDQLRAATLGAKKQFRSKKVEFNGHEFEIRQPSIRDRRDLSKKCSDSEGNIDMMDFLIYSVIANTFVPGTNEKVFEQADYESFLEMPTGSFLDKFGEAASEMMNVNTDEIEGKSEN